MLSHRRVIREVDMAQVLRQEQQRQAICVCCVCGEARDDIAADGTWYSLKAYLSRYRIQEQDLMFSHTFCPYCFMHYKELLGLAPGRSTRVLYAGPGGRTDNHEQGRLSTAGRSR